MWKSNWLSWWFDALYAFLGLAVLIDTFAVQLSLARMRYAC